MEIVEVPARARAMAAASIRRMTCPRRRNGGNSRHAEAVGERNRIRWCRPGTGRDNPGSHVPVGFSANARIAPRVRGSVPAAIYFIFSGIAAFGAASDAWALARGGLKDRSRILQHLPEALQGSFLLQVPEILVVGLLVFWLLRVAFSTMVPRPTLPSAVARPRSNGRTTIATSRSSTS
ncbi:hypothetical protein [Luteimonas salinilitoris]|uniref:DUF4386 family protein n=1 Tax=Luteimonas salinilitoris TaxID=3237697 RepID=A0ABV4HPX5_9GAMM